MNTYKMFPMYKREEALAYTLRYRSLFMPKRKIAGEIAFRYDLDYAYALQFVLHAEIKHAKRIARAQLVTALLLGSIVFFISGSALWEWLVQPLMTGGDSAGFIAHLQTSSQIGYTLFTGALFLASIAGIMKATMKFILVR